jgi:diguanylate cyclase (GGDEF)-like protein
VCAEHDLWELGIGVVDDLAEHEGDPAGRLRDAGMQSVVELRVSPDHPRALLRLAFDGPPERFELANNDLVVVLAHTVMSTLRRCAAEQRLRERARRDPLTGLLNREAFYRVLDRLVASPRHVGTVGVLYGDVDRFKDLNDRLGHGAGDEVLHSVAAAFEASVRDGDVVARFGGDEFVAVCRDLDAAPDLRAIAERVEERVAEVAVGPARLSVSVGCAVWEQGQSADDLIGAADADMYRVKRRRRAATG